MSKIHTVIYTLGIHVRTIFVFMGHLITFTMTEIILSFMVYVLSMLLYTAGKGSITSHILN